MSDRLGMLKGAVDLEWISGKAFDNLTITLLWFDRSCIAGRLRN